MAVNFYTLTDDSLGNREQNGLYKLSNITVKSYDFTENQLGLYRVPREHEMRIDLICMKLYDSLNYVEELMKLNNILHPFAIKEGDVINYLPLDLLNLMHAEYKENELQPTNLSQVDAEKSSNKEKREPSEKPREIKQIVEDKQAKKVKIINNFQT
jgi:hypothetical protein